MSIRILDASSPTLAVAPVPGAGMTDQWDLLNAGRQVARFRSAGAAQRYAQRFYGEADVPVLPRRADQDSAR